jgi:phage terminase small subunit
VSEQKLTDKQEMFVNEYLKCFNATKAAKKAGYSEKTAGAIGSENLAKPEIASRIRERMQAAAMDTNEVLYHLAQIARGDMDDVLDDHGTIDLFKARDAGKTNLIKRVKTKSITTADKDGEGSDIFESETEAYDRMRALELIGKHLAMWTERVRVDDWRSQAIADIRAGIIPFEALAEAFDNDLAAALFREAGVPVSAR